MEPIEYNEVLVEQVRAKSNAGNNHDVNSLIYRYFACVDVYNKLIKQNADRAEIEDWKMRLAKSIIDMNTFVNTGVLPKRKRGS